MRIIEYSKLALRTESQGHSTVQRLNHAALGLVSEFAELVEVGSDYLEELGDLFWYLNLAADALGTTLDNLDESSFEPDADSIMNIGACAGNFSNWVKRAIFYNENIEEVNKKGIHPKGEMITHLCQLKRELFAVAEEFDYEIEDILESNIKKLEVRYHKLRFCDQDAVNRNIEKEKEAL